MKKAYRIKKSKEIEILIKNKKTIANSYFVVYYIKNYECNNFRYALSVSKKYGNAVERNLVKRRVRSIIRENKIDDVFDFFVVIKPKTKKLNFEDIKNNLKKLLIKVKIMEENNEV